MYYKFLVRPVSLQYSYLNTRSQHAILTGYASELLSMFVFNE